MSNTSDSLERILNKLRSDNDLAKHSAIEEILYLEFTHPRIITALKSIAMQDKSRELRQVVVKALAELGHGLTATEMMATSGPTASAIVDDMHERRETVSKSKLLCSRCGTELPNNAKFCLNCGAATSTVQQSQPQPIENLPVFEQNHLINSAPQSRKSTSYEICEILLERLPPSGCIFFFDPYYCFFKAEVIGGDRRLVARTPDLVYKLMWLRKEKDGDSDYFDSVKEIPEYKKAVDSLIGELTNEGWQLLAVKGNHWYNYRLQRHQ
jgi:ribosomal protein L40E